MLESNNFISRIIHGRSMHCARCVTSSLVMLVILLSTGKSWAKVSAWNEIEIDSTSPHGSESSDKGNWTFFGVGAHFDIENYLLPDQGPLTSRITLLLGEDFRFGRVASCPIEFQWYVYRKGGNPESKSSTMLSASLKLRMQIAELTLYGQFGLGLLNFGSALGFPFGGGLEVPLNERLNFGMQYRFGSYIALQEAHFIIIIISIR